MFKTISIALLSALLINIVSLNVYNLYVEQEFKGQVVTTNYLNDKITKLKSNLLIQRPSLLDLKKYLKILKHNYPTVRLSKIYKYLYFL